MSSHQPGLRAACGLLVWVLLLAACAPAPSPATPTVTATSAPATTQAPSSAPSAEPTATPTPAPSATPPAGQVFKSLAEVAPRLDFTALQASYTPEGLPLKRITYSDEAVLRMYYSLRSLDNPAVESSPRMVVVTQSARGAPINEQTIANPDYGALDALATRVRGQPGFFYWMYTQGGQPSYQLAWREGSVNISVALTGSWAGPDQSGPHALDPLLLQIASGLTQDTSAWQKVSSQDGTLSFSIPPEWNASGVDVYDGADGFARLERYAGPGNSLGDACEQEANLHPELYGTQPELSYLYPAEPYHSPCMIRPDSGQAAILLPVKSGSRPLFQILRVSARYALAIASTLLVSEWPEVSQSTAAPVATPSPNVRPQTLNWQGLSVEMYPLGRPSPALDVMLSAPPDVLDKRRDMREQPAEPAEQITLNGHTLTLSVISVPHRWFENEQVQVSTDGQVIFRYNQIEGLYHSMPRLYAWQGQWVLNVGNMLVINGEIANRQLGYDEIHGWSLLGGKPFYFFRKDGLTRISLNNVIFPVVFDQVYQASPYAMGSNERMAWFYALKEGILYYIEMGSY